MEVGLPFKRSLIALLANGACVWFPGAVTFGLIGLLTPTWASMFNVGRGPLGLIMTSLLISVGVFMYLGGRWSDRLGARPVAIAGSLLAAGSLAMFPYAPNIYLLYVLAFTWGAGVSLVYVPAVSSSQKWFPAKRGLASGVVSMLFGISASFMVFPFQRLLTIQGYTASLFTVAALTAIVGVASAQLIEFPERLGYAISPRPGLATTSSIALGEALKTKVFWLTWLTWALCGGAGIGMVVFSTSISLEIGLTTTAAATCLAAFNLTNGLGRIVSGALSDRFRRSVVMAGFYLASAAGFLILAARLVSDVWGVAFANLLAGLAFGTLFAVSAPYLMDHFGPAHFGAIFGFTFTAYGFIGSWLGPFIGGLLRDLTGSFTATCLAFAAYTLISAAAIIIAGDVKQRR